MTATTHDDILKAMNAAADSNNDNKAKAEVEAAAGAAQLDAAEILAAQQPAPELIEDLLFDRELHMLIAEGGVGKTTMLVAALIDYVLDRDVLGWFKAKEPRGPVLIVTSEDRRAQLLRVANRVLAAMFIDDESGLAAAAAKVANRLHIFDCSHEVTALHVWSRDASSWEWSTFALKMVGVIRKTGARILMLDPLGMFFGGEENDNGYAQRLMKDLRAKVADECGVAVVGVHHVAKSIAREGTSDQHVGRGASALAGNARGVMHMAPLRVRTVTFRERTWSVPKAVSAADLTGGKVLVLYQHKYSYAPTWDGPVVVLRDGFAFKARAMELTSADQRRLEQSQHIAGAVMAFLRAPERQLPMPRQRVIDMRAQITDERGKAYGRDALLACIEQLIEAGDIETAITEKNRVDIVKVAPPVSQTGGNDDGPF